MIRPTHGRAATDGHGGLEAPTMTRHSLRVGAVRIRVPAKLMMEMRADLERPHGFAAERVGFLSVGTGSADAGETLVIARAYHTVADRDYIADDEVGARIGPDAIRGALQRALSSGDGVFHVHMHPHRGAPDFSYTDATELPPLMEAIRRGAPTAAHGMLVLSHDAAHAWVWAPGQTSPCLPALISVVDRPMQFIAPPDRPRGQNEVSDRYLRQGFLGAHAERLTTRARIAVVGLGGGGSHVVQQLAHVGFRCTRGFDGDQVDESNLNRLVGAWSVDAKLQTRKVDVAKRTVEHVLPEAEFVGFYGRWQDRPELLRGCDVVVGCVDSFAERQQLEVACRRYAVPYVDIGMDVHQVGSAPPRVAGQLILSLPGQPCMFCLGFLNEERLAEEAARYGAAGNRPQVVWPNGVLASTAVGVVVDLVTGWSGVSGGLVYLSYDGNTGSMLPHPRLRFLRNAPCPHYPAEDVGDPVFRRVLG